MKTNKHFQTYTEILARKRTLEDLSTKNYTSPTQVFLDTDPIQVCPWGTEEEFKEAVLTQIIESKKLLNV